MKLLLCDSKKIYTYQLRNNIEDSFIIDYYYDDSDIYETITLKCNEEKWSIENTPNIEFVGQKKDYYSEYDKVQIKFPSSNQIVTLYFLPIIENYIDISLNNIQSIKVGSSGTCNIILKNYTDNKEYFEIVKNENEFILKSLSDTCVYVNNYLGNDRIIRGGDVIFVNGLRLIWMNNFVKVSTYSSNISFTNLFSYPKKEIKTDFTPPTEYERNLKLFSDSQVFFHTPRLQQSIKDEVIKLDPPPEETKSEKMPLFLTLGTSSILCITSCVTGINAIRGNAGRGDKLGLILELVVSFAMIAISILIPVLTSRWQSGLEKKRIKMRHDKYTEYLNKKRAAIDKIIKNQEEILHNNNATLEEIEKRITNGAKNIWIREINDEDFLDIRLGSGEINANLAISAPEEHFTMTDDELRDEAMELANSKKSLTDVPITLSMSKNKITTFILNSEFKDKYIDSLMLQIMYYYSPEDLKIAIFTTEENMDKWNYAKYLPHMWSLKHDRRFFATNDTESLQLSSYLDQIYEKRIQEAGKNLKEENKNATMRSDLYKNYTEYYLIITDNFKEIKNIPIIDRILNSNTNIGFSLAIFDNSIKNLPSKLDKFVDVKNNVSGIYSKNLENNDKSQFKSEYLPSLRIEDYSKIIANVPVSNKTAGYNLPTTISFMELYHAGKISHLNITKKWAENNPTISLNAPLGIKDNGKMIGLDLHEKVHGPHGLIAGSTGSGKSEFIITYILSMAINYSPKEVQFILIDYKGGGLAGAFENRSKGIKIPHLVGTITNLDTSEMNRTLVSIQSELKRRQMKFNQAREVLGEGTIDIYKYQKLYREGKLKEPMSHLFVICDEFAELKSQQPEFMQELISTSRIGRSLGVHLILATQKPTGVVDDQIWSNARFKVCLKVQTESDSIELLKRPDAAMIKETGRFYLQVGNNELFEYGQSAWTGAKYVPVEHLRNKIDDSIDFLANDGSVTKTLNDKSKAKEQEENHGEQLTNIVKYLYDLAIKENIKFESLWLPSLPKTIYLQDIIKKYSYKRSEEGIKAIIGEYDKPSKQEQGIYELELSGSNTVIFGIPNSGKENYLYNVIYTASMLYTPKEVNFYILDFGSESLNPFSKLPHVGDYITVNNKDMILGEFLFLEKEMRKRKELFADYGGSYDSYIKNSGKKIPLIITILNSYESFMENYFDLDEFYSRLLREGNKYGIVFITTAVSTGAIRSSVLEYYSNRIILQTNEPFDYHYVLNAPSGMVPAKNFGRGITVINGEACEFQSAILADDNQLNAFIKTTSKNLESYYKYKVSPIRVLPQHVPLNSMFKYAKQINKIPIGYERDSAELYYYDFVSNKVTSIIGNNTTNDNEFMCSIIDLIDSIKNVKLNIFDFLTCIQTDGNASYYNVSFLEPFNEILSNNSDVLTVNIIIGLGNMFDVFDNDEKEMFNTIMKNIDNLQNQVFIIFDNNDRYSKVKDEEWFSNIDKNYIWVGKYIDSQNIFDVSNISNYDLEEDMSGLIYDIKDKYVVIKGVGGNDDG